MRMLYLDCGMGAAGDMFTAALLELLPEEEQAKMLERINSIGIEGVSVEAVKVLRGGIAGTGITVWVNGRFEGNDTPEQEQVSHEHNKHDHAHMTDIKEIVENLNLPLKVKDDVVAVYTLIAEAESHAHGVEVSEVHFHEVGMKDAIMDVAAVCLLMDHISPDRVISSPIHVGSGQVRCAHGIVPVPAPATAYLLQGAPVYGGEIEGELCTPTGAALLKYYVDEYGPMPLMVAERIGYGMGSKEYKRANCLRIMLGRRLEKDSIPDDKDKVTGLSCNVDDMTGEDMGFAVERLYENGAREVYTVAVGMKKSRPGILLEVLCAPEDKERIIRTIFRHTTTIGIRETEYNRYILDRREEERETKYGTVHVKHSEGYGVIREKYEYGDLMELAKDRDISLDELRRTL